MDDVLSELLHVVVAVDSIDISATFRGNRYAISHAWVDAVDK